MLVTWISSGKCQRWLLIMCVFCVRSLYFYRQSTCNNIYFFGMLSLFFLQVGKFSFLWFVFSKKNQFFENKGFFSTCCFCDLVALKIRTYFRLPSWLQYCSSRTSSYFLQHCVQQISLCIPQSVTLHAILNQISAFIQSKTHIPV